MNLLGLTYAQLEEQFQIRYNKGAFHAAALYRDFYRNSDFNLDHMDAFSKNSRLRQQVQTDLMVYRPLVLDRIQQQGVIKLVLRLHDGLRVETVVIPMTNHATVCVSCQVGCRMGCGFCRTGQMGWHRNLSADEIVAQVYLVKLHLGFKIRNVVFMGMGEPLDNFEQVVQAIQVIADQRGLDIAQRHITLSTVGLPEGIKKLAALNWPHLKLAVSLNAPGDHIRNRLMPVNLRFPMADLKEALIRYPLSRGNAVFIEYVLIKGINDHPRHAALLASYFEGLPVKFNLIAYNPNPGSPFEAPDTGIVQRFQRALLDQRIFVRLRNPKGTDIRAACGQLGGAG